MSDIGRKDLSDKVADKITPDSSKSTTDKVGDGVTGTVDKAKRDVVPDSQKSTTQSVSDKMSREKDSHSSTTTTGDASILDKAKSAVGIDSTKH